MVRSALLVVAAGQSINDCVPKHSNAGGAGGCQMPVARRDLAVADAQEAELRRIDDRGRAGHERRSNVPASQREAQLAGLQANDVREAVAPR
jgi:hypothetical protein